jgi:hypothetical protein
MTTAPENRGGNNGGSQNNPASINPLGGNGQSGNNKQATRYIPDMKSLGSTGVDTMAQQSGASLAGNPTPSTPAPKLSIAEMLASTGMNTLMSDTDNPSEPINAGLDSQLPANVTADSRDLENIQVIQKYLPAMINASRIPGAPDSFKQFVNYAIGRING